MGEARLHERPKILDFSKRINDVSTTRDLAWPCHAYRVMVPVRPAGRLNLFEELVLKLLANARLSEPALAEKTCLDKSLIRLACCRLRDLGMLTEQNEIGRVGQLHLSQTDDSVFEPDVRIVFRERISGRLLPIVYTGELTSEDVEAWSERERSAKIVKNDRRNGGRVVHLRLLPPQAGAEQARPPTPAEVLWATNRHRELSRQYSALRVGVTPCPPIASGRQMNVDPNPERVFLRCRLVMPASGDDYRIGDPFGYGYSERLLRTYEALRSADQEEQKFVRDWMDRASTVRQPPIRSDAQDSDAEAAVLSRLDGAVRRYPDLFSRLKQVEKEFGRSIKPARSSAEDADRAYHREQAVQFMSEALEAALAQVMAQFEPAACESMLSSSVPSFERNAELLEELAARLGLRTTDSGSLLRVAPGRIQSLRDGTADLQALLAVTIASAIEVQDHPLRRLVVSFPNWLPFLWTLKVTRDAGAHGESRAAEDLQCKGLREGTYRSIELLLPNAQRRIAASAPSHDHRLMARDRDERRKAKSRLEDSFGIRWYSALSTGMVERFIQVELTTNALPRGAEPVEVRQTVKDLASILQSAVHVGQLDSEPVFRDDEHLREQAERRALHAGLLRAGAKLPAGLATVNLKRLQQAIQGRSPTLGANVMALLLLAPAPRLKRFSVVFPDILQLCARVIELRGHGNAPVFLRADEVLKLKDEVYKACTVLMEA